MEQSEAAIDALARRFDARFDLLSDRFIHRHAIPDESGGFFSSSFAG
jgi:hypothetical protein